MEFREAGRVSGKEGFSFLEMQIAAIQKVSLIEYPGKICAILFTQGCNFRCPYCHNPELVNPDLYGECLREEEIFDFLEKRRGKIDAVAITGGEPTIQQDLPEFIKRIKNLKYYVKIDTNGSNPEVIEKLVGKKLVDYIAMDVKAPPDKYNKVTKSKIGYDKIKQSVELIMKSGIPYEFRTTLLKQILRENDILKIGNLLKNAKCYVLQQFIPTKVLDEEFLKYESYSREELEVLGKKLAKTISTVLIR